MRNAYPAIHLQYMHPDPYPDSYSSSVFTLYMSVPAPTSSVPIPDPDPFLILSPVPHFLILSPVPITIYLPLTTCVPVRIPNCF